jgi:hypothetical protein
VPQLQSSLLSTISKYLLGEVDSIVSVDKFYVCVVRHFSGFVYSYYKAPQLKSQGAVDGL